MANTITTEASAKRREMRKMKRFEAKRRDRAFQTRRAQLLAPFLKLAASIDFNEPAPAPWQAESALIERICRTKQNATLARGFLGFRSDHDEQAGREFYWLFWSVRTALESLIEAWAHREQWADLKGTGAQSTAFQVQFPGVQTISLNKDGDVSLNENPVVEMFKKAIEGIDLSRLRRCPVCSRIYYAERKNKQACDQHLALARLWRLRGKLPEYNAGRRFRRRAKLSGIRGKKRKEVMALSEAVRGNIER